jgi:hypothetical protein
MLYLKIQNDQELVQIGKAVVSAGTTDLEVQFDVGGLYVGELIAYFNVAGRNDTPYSVTVTDGKCLVPWEVLATSCEEYNSASEKLPANINHMVIVSIADQERTTSSACRIPVYKSVFADDTEEPTEPSDTLTQQIWKKVPTKGSVADNSMKFGNEYNEDLFSVDVSGLGGGSTTQPTTTAVDFSNWSNGTWEETLSDGSKVTHTVTFDDSGRPATIDGASITWGDS